MLLAFVLAPMLEENMRKAFIASQGSLVVFTDSILKLVLLAIFLLDELSKTGNPRINLTHEQIAKYMGSAREVVSRMLKYFAKEGMIEMSRGGIRILDKEKLRELTV